MKLGRTEWLNKNYVADYFRTSSRNNLDEIGYDVM